MSGRMAIVRAEFTRDSRFLRVADLRLELIGEVVWLRGGPTGYESFYVADWGDGDTWSACAGGMGWDRCLVTGMDRALRELGVGDPA